MEVARPIGKDEESSIIKDYQFMIRANFMVESFKFLVIDRVWIKVFKESAWISWQVECIRTQDCGVPPSGNCVTSESLFHRRQ